METKSRHQYKRYLKNYLIMPAYQLNHALITFGAILIGCGFLAILVIKKIESVFQNISIRLDPSMAKTELIFYVSLSFISATVLIGGMMIVLNIIHTHRVFGALYAIEQKLRTLKQDGKIEKITSRKFDQSGDIVQLLNEILAQSTATSEKKLDS